MNSSNDSAPLLGVARSVTGHCWRARLDAAGEARAQVIVQHWGLPDLLARVLAGRGVPPEAAQEFLDPTVRRLMPDPSTLVAMDEACARLAHAAQQGETVGIFGDYDVDGAASSALLADYLERAGAQALVHIPDRIFEGYGPNTDAIDRFAAAGARLLVTVDCGTTSTEAIAHARALGLDVVVLDHHQAPEQLPGGAIIVNPNRQDDISGLGHLCAAGVVFMTLVALGRALRHAGHWSEDRPEPNLLAELDLVALATVADVVPLTGLNRAFVVKGLELMKARGRPGLAALLDVAKAGGPPRAYHLGFLIGPRINAGGRIGDAALGAKLLRLQDPIEAARIAADLDRLNRERQVIEAGTLEEAEALALSLEAGGEGAVTLAHGEGWHPGVVGLVAARLKERSRRPAFAIAFEGERGTGSGRSIPGVDLGRAVREAVEAGLLIKGGGHAMAAGVTLTRGQLEGFRTFLEARFAQDVQRLLAATALDVDGMLTAAGAQVELVTQIERAGPYGAGNPEPVFVLANHRVVDCREVGEKHLRVTLASGDGTRLSAMAFRAMGTPLGDLLRQPPGPLHVAGHLSVDRWRGAERVDFRLVDAADPRQAG